MSEEITMEEWRECKLWQIDVPETGEVILQLQKGNKITGSITVDRLIFLAHADYYIKKLANEYDLHDKPQSKGGRDG